MSFFGLLFLFIVAEGVWNNILHPRETISGREIADIFEPPAASATATPEPLTTPSTLVETTPASAPTTFDLLGGRLAAANFSCLATEFVGLTCINRDGSWSTFTAENADFRADVVLAMATCGDRAIVLATNEEVVLYDGNRFAVIPESSPTAQPADIACDENGNIWLAYYEGAAHYAGSSWTTYPHSGFAEDTYGLVDDVEIGPEGTVWLLTSHRLSAFDPSSQNWTFYDEENGLGKRYFFRKMALDQNGWPIATTADQFVGFVGSEWLEQQIDEDIFMDDLFIDENGDFWAETFSDGIFNVTGNGPNRITTADGLSSDEVNAITADTTGRLWVGTEFGLNLLDEGVWHIYDQANSEILHPAIDHIAVIGAGPPLPPADRDLSGYGSLSGKLHMRETGSGVTQIKVAVCQTDRPIEASACGKALPPLQSVSTRGGVYRFTSLTAGNYWIAVDMSGTGNWEYAPDPTTGEPLEILVESGEEIEIEPILMPLIEKEEVEEE